MSWMELRSHVAEHASLGRAGLFFTTKDCLRADKSTCFAPDSPYYAVTHGGIDPMVSSDLLQASNHVWQPAYVLLWLP